LFYFFPFFDSFFFFAEEHQQKASFPGEKRQPVFRSPNETQRMGSISPMEISEEVLRLLRRDYHRLLSK
jgi:hypothetical protein